MADIIPILKTGDSAKRVDIVIVAEGYTLAERDKFIADANTFITSFLSKDNARLNAPFSDYQGFFNATALFFASEQSGTDQPNNNIQVKTYFEATQHGSDGRLLYGDGAKVEREVAGALTPDAHELIIVLVNTPLYGGAGGSIAWASAGNRLASELALHEIGHSFANLQDEYVDSVVAKDFPTTNSEFRNSAHVTDSLSRIPWQDWMGYADGELGVIGTYEGGYYRSNGIWRATQNSKMLYLDVPFSAPQKEAFALKYYQSIGDYLSVGSVFPGMYSAATPNNGLFSYTWKSGAMVLANGSQKTVLDGYGYGVYTSGNSFSLTTIDNSGIIRKNLSSTQQVEIISERVAVKDISTVNYVSNVTDANQILRFTDAKNLIEIPDVQTIKNIYFDGGAGNDVMKFGLTLSTLPQLQLHRLETGTIMLGMQESGMWALRNIENIQFQDFSLNLSIRHNASSLPVTVLKSLQELYVAFFNRVPDANGLNYWIDEFKSGRSLTDIANSFYGAALEYGDLTEYTANMPNQNFINVIYKNVLGRPDGADAGGLAYWTGLLSTGQTRGSVVHGILDSAHSYKGDVTWGWVADLLDNKALVANKFAVDWGLNYLDDVTSIKQGIEIAKSVRPTDTQAALALIGIAEGQILFT